MRSLYVDANAIARSPRYGNAILLFVNGFVYASNKLLQSPGSLKCFARIRFKIEPHDRVTGQIDRSVNAAVTRCDSMVDDQFVAAFIYGRRSIRSDRKHTTVGECAVFDGEFAVPHLRNAATPRESKLKVAWYFFDRGAKSN